MLGQNVRINFLLLYNFNVHVHTRVIPLQLVLLLGYILAKQTLFDSV